MAKSVFTGFHIQLSWAQYPAQLGPISSSNGPNIQLNWAQYPTQLGPIPSSNGPNIQLKWAQYPAQMGPISSSRRRTFQTVNATELASRLEISTELLVFALISRHMCGCLENPFAGVYQTCSDTSLNRESVRQK